MRLHTLKKIKGEKRPRKRVGRGHGSGHGKASGTGHNGSKSRSGYSISPMFEGGQMPLARKLPKRGFSNYEFRVSYDVVNLADIEKLEGTEIDRLTLVRAGLLRNNSRRFKVLGNGELTKALTVSADKFSASAKAKIEAAGGKAIEESIKKPSEQTLES